MNTKHLPKKYLDKDASAVHGPRCTSSTSWLESAENWDNTFALHSLSRECFGLRLLRGALVAAATFQTSLQTTPRGTIQITLRLSTNPYKLPDIDPTPLQMFKYNSICTPPLLPCVVRTKIMPNFHLRVFAILRQPSTHLGAPLTILQKFLYPPWNGWAFITSSL